MRITTIILILFMAIAASMTALILFSSKEFRIDKTGAASFGISPTYLDFENLKPGESAEASIRVMRGDDDEERQVTARFDGLEVAGWITCQSGESLAMKKGEQWAWFKFRIKVPLDAPDETYRGKLDFAMLDDKKSGGVGISLGARADVVVSVGETKKQAGSKQAEGYSMPIAESPLAGRLHGSFVMRTEAKGQIYYIHKEENKMYYLGGEQEQLSALKDIGNKAAAAQLEAIPLDLDALSGTDSDADGLPNEVEAAIGTDPDSKDSDKDGYDDLYELAKGFSPSGKNQTLGYGKIPGTILAGSILLDADTNNAWYINPRNNKKVFIESESYLDILKRLALGVSEDNFKKLLK